MRPHLRRLAGFATFVGVAGLLLAPAVWSTETTLAARGGLTPSAGPQTSFGAGGRLFNTRSGGQFSPPAGSSPGSGVPGGGQVDQALINYLLNNQGATKFLLATPSSNEAAPIILATGKPVMALGGFSGNDQILTASQLARLVADNTVRFFLVSGGGFGQRTGQRFNPSDDDEDRFPPRFEGDEPNARSSGGAPGFGQSDGITNWVVANCKAVPSSTWDTGQATGINGANQFDGFGGEQLYDCAGVRD